MKTAGIILLLLSGVLLTVKIYLSYTKRASVLRQLISDTETLKNEIVFKKSTLYEALTRMEKEGICREFYKRTLGFLKEGSGIREAFSGSVKVFSDCFEKEDETAVCDFGKLLGATDMDGQLRAFEIFSESLKKNLGEAEKNIKEKMKSKCAAVIFAFAAAGLFVL